MHAPQRNRPRARHPLTGVVAALLAVLVLAGSPARSVAGAPSDVGETGPPVQGPAADTVVVVVSSENPVTELSRLHLADLYLGRTSSLPNGESAEPIDQEPGSQARREFYETYLGRSPSEIKAHWSKAVFTGRGRPPRNVDNGEAMKEFLAENPGAVGYLDRRLVDESVHVVRVTGME